MVYNTNIEPLQYMINQNIFSKNKLAQTERAESIRRYLLNEVKAGKSHFIRRAAAAFNVSRQTIFDNLKALVEKGYLSSQGITRARTYKMGPKRRHSVVLPLKGLEESAVYYEEFGFIFSDLNPEIQKICDFGFTEMLNNAIDHSGGKEVKVIVIRDEKSVLICIDDNGEGIFNHIARIFHLSDPRESILELSKGKLTTDPNNHSGQGIFFTSRVFDSFFIDSGDLMFTHLDGEKNDFLLHNGKESSAGTRVWMEITLDSTKNLRAVFDSFTGSEEESFAFNKTVVPVKLALYEGERLVSRSQAKRILHRIDKFKSVVLDFKGVDMIGQAFADEVFRIFARKNPTVELIPINESDDVRKTIISARSTH